MYGLLILELTGNATLFIWEHSHWSVIRTILQSAFFVRVLSLIVVIPLFSQPHFYPTDNNLPRESIAKFIYSTYI